jgi:hypothetical protein
LSENRKKRKGFDTLAANNKDCQVTLGKCELCQERISVGWKKMQGAILLWWAALTHPFLSPDQFLGFPIASAFL